MTEHCGSD